MAEELREPGANAALGRIDVVNKILAELMKLQGWRLSEERILRHRCLPAIRGTRFRPASRVVLVLLLATASLAAGCGRTNAAPTVPSPDTGGVTGYLEVLTHETNTFSAELALVQARQNELLALVQLYEALGGGWQQ
jgi:hypothetical protein